MNYREQLSPWAIVQLLPDCQRRTIARYRRRSESEAYVQILKRVMPHSTLAIVFDPGEGDLGKEEAIESDREAPASARRLKPGAIRTKPVRQATDSQPAQAGFVCVAARFRVSVTSPQIKPSLHCPETAKS